MESLVHYGRVCHRVTRPTPRTAILVYHYLVFICVAVAPLAQCAHESAGIRSDKCERGAREYNVSCEIH